MRGLPDLHCHLDGSLRPQTLVELANAIDRVVPDDLIFVAGMGLADALMRFELTVSVLQSPESIRRVAGEICEDAQADRVTTLEIRFAPQLHGIGIEAAVQAAIDGIDGRAGLILCALYGEPPIDVMSLVEVGAKVRGVVGIDLAGGPTDDHRWGLRNYADAFTAARDAGLGRTVHAGEGRPPDEIRIAVEELHAQRIGHATSLLDDPSVTDLVVEREVVIEACPTSNVHTGAIASFADHPLAQWIAKGVRVCICSDNTLLSDVSVSGELARVADLNGIGDAEIARLIETGHRAAFTRS